MRHCLLYTNIYTGHICIFHIVVHRISSIFGILLLFVVNGGSERSFCVVGIVHFEANYLCISKSAGFIIARYELFPFISSKRLFELFLDLRMLTELSSGFI